MFWISCTYYLKSRKLEKELELAKLPLNELNKSIDKLSTMLKNFDAQKKGTQKSELEEMLDTIEKMKPSPEEKVPTMKDYMEGSSVSNYYLSCMSVMDKLYNMPIDKTSKEIEDTYFYRLRKQVELAVNKLKRQPQKSKQKLESGLLIDNPPTYLDDEDKQKWLNLQRRLNEFREDILKKYPAGEVKLSAPDLLKPFEELQQELPKKREKLKTLCIRAEKIATESIKATEEESCSIM